MKKYKLPIEKQRKKAWWWNALFSIPLRLSKTFRNKNIWVFGAWAGDRYDDSSKYLFEYVNKAHSGIEAYWITNKTGIADSIVADGNKALLIGTKEAKRIMLRAGVCFYSNGLDDFGSHCYVYGSFIVNLNHGVCGVKYLCYEPRKEYENTVLYFLKIIKHKIFNWYYFDYTTTSSEYAKKFWIYAFGLKEKAQNKIKIHGLPRNDMMTSNRSHNDEKVIVYMPTFRPYDNDIVAVTLSYLDSDDEFQRFLSEKNVKILVKLHNVDNTSERIAIKSKRISLIEGEDVKSVQELLSSSEVLITDYSSCCIDFAITNRPTIIYAPDYEMYDKKNGLIDFWKEKLQSLAVISPEELIEHIKRAVLDASNELSATDFLNDTFRDPTLINKSSRETVFNYVRNAIEGNRREL